MTPQEAINRIKNHIEVHRRKEPHFAIRILEALYMAIEALEKQIQKKPVLREMKCFDGSTDDFVFVCPVMTDNEIIDVLKNCSNGEPCENCPYKKQCDETNLAEIALDLINRQKAENEALYDGLQSAQETISSYKAEIERLKEKLSHSIGIDNTKENGCFPFD